MLENRIDIYYNMELERQFHPEFFDSSAPYADIERKTVLLIYIAENTEWCTRLSTEPCFCL